MMRKNIKEKQSSFKIPHITMMLFLTFFIFTFIGAGSIIVVSCVGLFLCIIGLMQSSVRVDLWILIPLIFYNVVSLFSGYRIYGTTVDGLASTQSVFPVVYLLAAYLSGGERTLLKRWCAIWVGMIAFIGFGQFTLSTFHGNADRLSGLMGNPNAMGAMLVLGWFALQSCIGEVQEGKPALKRFFQGLEFLTLIALALTLSFGSFGALGIGIIAMHIYGKGNLSTLILRTAEIVFAVGCGILLYIAGCTANWPWLCLVLSIYILSAAICQNAFRLYLADCRWISTLICLAGVCSAGVLLFLRPNAAATLTERLAMIKNGLGYFGKNPLLGVGPYQWRWLNLQDTDPYFNTWHIHNVFVHVGVELGLIALAMLIITAIRHASKREDEAQRGMFFASLIHNMMDTSFFYMATVPFLIMTAANDERRTRLLSGTVVKCIFGGFAALFTWNLIQCLL